MSLLLWGRMGRGREMEEKKRYSIKKILLTVLWVSISAVTTVLLVAAIRKKDAAKCKGIEIKITGIEKTDGLRFVDEEDVQQTIKAICNGNPKLKPISAFDLRKMEAELEKSKWVRNAELFFDNNDVLNVLLQEREPVARVFTATGASFYIDTALAMLPLSDKYTARLPVFTGFPNEQQVLSAADSGLLRDISTISIAMQKDSFRTAMIDQVDITPQRSFEMIPKIGNQLIVFGDASAAEEKFNKLELFYKEVMMKAGWHTYSVINVQYKNQVVAKKWGAEDKTADSLRTLQIMQMIAANAARQAQDSLNTIEQDNSNNTPDSSMIQQSIQRDEHAATGTVNELPLEPENKQPVFNPENTNPLPSEKHSGGTTPASSHSNPSQKPGAVKPAATNSKPAEKPGAKAPPKKPVVPAAKPQPQQGKTKAVMPAKNDY
ncbi:MAG: hypothetical protein JST86_05215 [Bacteroidetes bacterium]|nr:hypothetical protein [Bacteroidota bacterium]